MLQRIARQMLILATAPGITFAADDGDRIAQLEARLQAVESELETYKQYDRIDHQRVGEVAGTKQAVMEDARAQSEFRPTAGYSNGFYLSSPDSNFQIKLNGLFQPRYIYNADADGDRSDESGFEMRRTELYLTGHTIKPGFFFQFGGGFNRDRSGVYLVSAYAGYQFNEEWEIRGGAFKAPFLVEELTSAAKQTTVERSLLNQYFTAGTAEGFQVQYVRPDYRIAAMLHDGGNSAATDFASDRTDLGIASRLEWKIAGAWSQLSDFQGWDDTKRAARLGVGVDYELGKGDTANRDVLKYTLDLTVKNRGWGLLLAGVGKYTLADGDADAISQYGLLAQAGVFLVPNRVELFGRYEFIHLDGYYSATAVPIDNNLNLVTVGVNYFLVGHNAKLTTDIVYVFDALPENATGVGLMASPGGDQFIARMGMTLFF